MSFLQELEADLVSASRRISDAKQDTVPRRAATRRGTVVMAVVMGALALAAAAFAASELVKSGSPVRSPAALSPRSGIGVAVAAGHTSTVGSYRPVLSALDPTGGLPWGMRIVNTTRGLRCLQFGRLQDGQLGILGQDGQFGDDRLFHPLPPSVIDEDTCIESGSYLMAYAAAEPASGSSPEYGTTGCIAPGVQSKSRLVSRCPQQDERQLLFGLLGRDALAVTYQQAGSPHTLPVLAGSGAYLIVLEQSSRVGPYTSSIGTFSGRQGEPQIDVGSPILSVTYRLHGRVCDISADGSHPAAHPPCEGSAPSSTASRRESAGLLAERVRRLRNLVHSQNPGAALSASSPEASGGQRPLGGGTSTRHAPGQSRLKQHPPNFTLKIRPVSSTEQESLSGEVGHELLITFIAEHAVSNAHYAYGFQIQMPFHQGCGLKGLNGEDTGGGFSGQAIEHDVSSGERVKYRYVLWSRPECEGTVHGEIGYGHQPDNITGPEYGGSHTQYRFSFHIP